MRTYDTAHGILTQCYVGDPNGQEIKKRGDICVYIADYFVVQ